MVAVLELIAPGQARLTPAMLEGGPGAPAHALEFAVAAAATSAGAPVFLNDRAVALVAAGGPAPEGNVISIEALGELLESEALAALH
jgi:hypothetical protein